MRALLLGCAFAALAAPAFAACVEAPTNTYTCTGAATGQIRDGSDEVRVTVEAGASLTTTGRKEDAMRVDGDNARVINNGTIDATASKTKPGKKPKADGVQSDGANLTVINTGVIRGAVKGVKADETSGLNVDNRGRIEGGEEGVDGADGFVLNNRAGAVIIGRADDAVSSGDVDITNRGDIISKTDDGVDADSGVIRNYGRIISERDSLNDQPAAINVDAKGENKKPAPSLRVENYAGGLIDGYVGIEFEQNIPSDGKTSSTASQSILNAGLIRGRSGVAVRLGPDQASSDITLTGNGLFDGDVIFGADDDRMIFDKVASNGALGGVFDGKGGLNVADFSSWLKKTDLLSMVILGDVFKLRFNNVNGGGASASFRNFQLFRFADGEYRLKSGALVSAPVPLPAALPMLGLGLAGLAMLGRRR